MVALVIVYAKEDGKHVKKDKHPHADEVSHGKHRKEGKHAHADHEDGVLASVNRTRLEHGKEQIKKTRELLHQQEKELRMAELEAFLERRWAEKEKKRDARIAEKILAVKKTIAGKANDPAAVPAATPAVVPAAAPAAVPATIPVAVPADVPAAVPADVPVAVPAAVPAVVPAVKSKREAEDYEATYAHRPRRESGNTELSCKKLPLLMRLPFT